MKNKKKILVIAPHPDDETLGCGGYLHKLKHSCEISCLVVTKMDKDKVGSKRYNERQVELAKIKKIYNFKNFIQLNFYTSEIDQYPKNKIIDEFSNLFNKIKPTELLVPAIQDIHSDHKIINECALAASKSFRQPHIQKIMEYETLSETNFSIKESFHPNFFVDISKSIKKKISSMKIYKSEIKKHPFPRSISSITSQSILRGSQSGFKFAEAFNVVFEKEK